MTVGAYSKIKDPTKDKKMYTVPLPAIGSEIADFTCASLNDDKFSLSEYAGERPILLLLDNTTCPFSKKAVESLADLEEAFKGEQFSLLILNFGQSEDGIKGYYSDNAKERTVLVDQEKKICKEIFKVDVSPFFFLIGKDNKILDRKPYSFDQAKLALGNVLGVKTSCSTPSGAG